MCPLGSLSPVMQRPTLTHPPPILSSPWCLFTVQVEGCCIDLGSLRYFFRKQRICGKCPLVCRPARPACLPACLAPANCCCFLCQPQPLPLTHLDAPAHTDGSPPCRAACAG